MLKDLRPHTQASELWSCFIVPKSLLGSLRSPWLTEICVVSPLPPERVPNFWQPRSQHHTCRAHRFFHPTGLWTIREQLWQFRGVKIKIKFILSVLRFPLTLRKTVHANSDAHAFMRVCVMTAFKFLQEHGAVSFSDLRIFLKTCLSVTRITEGAGRAHWE